MDLPQGYRPDGSAIDLYCWPYAGSGLGTSYDYMTFVSHLYKAYHGKTDSVLENAATKPHSAATALESPSGISHLAAKNLFEMQSGVWIFKAGKRTIAFHMGWSFGFRNEFYLVLEGPDQGKGFVMISNCEGIYYASRKILPVRKQMTNEFTI